MIIREQDMRKQKGLDISFKKGGLTLSKISIHDWAFIPLLTHWELGKKISQLHSLLKYHNKFLCCHFPHIPHLLT